MQCVDIIFHTRHDDQDCQQDYNHDQDKLPNYRPPLRKGHVDTDTVEKIDGANVLGLLQKGSEHDPVIIGDEHPRDFERISRVQLGGCAIECGCARVVVNQSSDRVVGLGVENLCPKRTGIVVCWAPSSNESNAG